MKFCNDLVLVTSTWSGESPGDGTVQSGNTGEVEEIFPGLTLIIKTTLQSQLTRASLTLVLWSQTDQSPSRYRQSRPGSAGGGWSSIEIKLNLNYITNFTWLSGVWD